MINTIDRITETTTQPLFKAFTVGILGECTQTLHDLRWMIVLAIILILSDLWFGISASRVQGIEIRKSRAGRKTLNKTETFNKIYPNNINLSALIILPV